jgi:predicted phage baseplate assembly protein
MLPNVGPMNLQDLSSPPVTYLTLEAAQPSAWTSLFGVAAQPALNPDLFNLEVVYDPPSGGVGVALPVTLERFTNLSLSAAADQVNADSELISVKSFAQTVASGLSAYDLMNFDPTEAIPTITLAGTSNATTQIWSPALDLLESGESDLVFVVEVDMDGTATLRFGDNINGRMPDTGTTMVANYRIGNGTAGNLGADSLVFLTAPDARIKSCRNPLPATGGTDPETNDQIRRRAPQAFLTQKRAVTMADYEAVAEANPQVDQAVASLRWTGSWYTVSIAVQPKGDGILTPTLQRTLKQTEEIYRLAGQDLELGSPKYLSLEIELQVCVDPNYFRSDVEKSLLQVLGNKISPNGQKGLFYPDNFTFGQTVYLSPVYVAARSVAGVVAVTATKFQPQGVSTTQYLAAGEIKLGRLQVARLDNDPNFPDHGQLTLLTEGGE